MRLLWCCSAVRCIAPLGGDLSGEEGNRWLFGLTPHCNTVRYARRILVPRESVHVMTDWLLLASGCCWLRREKLSAHRCRCFFRGQSSVLAAVRTSDRSSSGPPAATIATVTGYGPTSNEFQLCVFNCTFHLSTAQDRFVHGGTARSSQLQRQGEGMQIRL